MKKLTTILGVVLFAALLFTSCSKKSASENTTVKKDSISVIDTIQSVSDNSSSTSTATTEPTNDCDKFIVEYRDYANNYVKIMKKYKKNPSDPTIVAEYTEMAQKASAMQESAAKCTDPKYSAEMLKLAQKMVDAMK